MALIRRAGGLLGWTAALAGLGAILTLAGGLIGTNPGWRPPERGITIYVETNGFHTGLVLPAQAAGIDWHRLFPPTDLADPRYHVPGATDHVAIGWGERAFYLETPQWSDLKLGTLARAARGSDRTLIHVYHLRRPAPGRYVRPLVISPAAYRRLSADLAAWLAPPDPRSGRRQAIAGYGVNDLFYPATGRYSLLYTCNTWTGDRLRAIGVRIGLWTPSEQAVMRWFPLPADQPAGPLRPMP